MLCHVFYIESHFYFDTLNIGLNLLLVQSKCLDRTTMILNVDNSPGMTKWRRIWTKSRFYVVDG